MANELIYMFSYYAKAYLNKPLESWETYFNITNAALRVISDFKANETADCAPKIIFIF